MNDMYDSKAPAMSRAIALFGSSGKIRPEGERGNG